MEEDKSFAFSGRRRGAQFLLEFAKRARLASGRVENPNPIIVGFKRIQKLIDLSMVDRATKSSDGMSTSRIMDDRRVYIFLTKKQKLQPKTNFIADICAVNWDVAWITFAKFYCLR